MYVFPPTLYCHISYIHTYGIALKWNARDRISPSPFGVACFSSYRFNKVQATQQNGVSSAMACRSADSLGVSVCVCETQPTKRTTMEIIVRACARLHAYAVHVRLYICRSICLLHTNKCTLYITHAAYTHTHIHCENKNTLSSELVDSVSWAQHRNVWVCVFVHMLLLLFFFIVKFYLYGVQCIRRAYYWVQRIQISPIYVMQHIWLAMNFIYTPVDLNKNYKLTHEKKRKRKLKRNSTRNSMQTHCKWSWRHQTNKVINCMHFFPLIFFS